MIEVYKIATLFIICLTCIVRISDFRKSSGELEAWGYILTACGSFWLLCVGLYWMALYPPIVNLDEMSYSFLVNSNYPVVVLNTGIIMLCLNAVVSDEIRNFSFTKGCSVVARQKAK